MLDAVAPTRDALASAPGSRLASACYRIVDVPMYLCTAAKVAIFRRIPAFPFYRPHRPPPHRSARRKPARDSTWADAGVGAPAHARRGPWPLRLHIRSLRQSTSARMTTGPTTHGGHSFAAPHLERTVILSSAGVTSRNARSTARGAD
jgi:hypothetical protein